MRILGIDPGTANGVCLVDAVSMRVKPIEMVYAVVLPRDVMFDQLPDLVESADLVAVERFIISLRTVRHTRQYDALYVVGATLMTCHRDRVRLELQTAADAKSAFSDEMLRRYGACPTNRHSRDAARHALLAARRHAGVL